MPLGVLCEQASGSIQTAFVPDAGEDVGNLALRRRGVADSIGSQQRQMKLSRQIDRRLVARFLIAIEVALQFNINIFPAKNGDKLLKQLPRPGESTVFQGMRQRAMFVAGKAYQSLSMILQFLQLSRCHFVFWSAQFCSSNQAAKVLISAARLY